MCCGVSCPKILQLKHHICGLTSLLSNFLGVQAMYGARNALCWNDSKRQNSMHLTLLKHQNTKTSLYKFSKDHWVMALLKKKLQLKSKFRSSFSWKCANKVISPHHPDEMNEALPKGWKLHGVSQGPALDPWIWLGDQKPHNSGCCKSESEG